MSLEDCVTSFAVIGSGAVGGFYGSKLAQAGHDVHFLFRQSAAHVREHGLNVRSIDGDYHLTDVSAHETHDTIPRCDVVIVAVKSNVNPDVTDVVAAVVKPGGVVVLIQNGLGGEPLFADALPADVEVIGGLAFLNSQRTGANEVTHMGNGGLTIAGYRPGYEPAGITPGMELIGAAYEGTTVPVTLDGELIRARWTKGMWNIPYNSLSVVLAADTSELMNEPASEALVRTIMEEVSAAAAADGCELMEGLMELMLDATRAMEPYATSMKVDYDAGRVLEVESIVGEPLRRGQGLGVSMPVIETVHRQLTFINARIGAV